MSGIRYQEKECFHSKWLHFPYLDIFSREGLSQAFLQLVETDEVHGATKDQSSLSSNAPFRNLFKHIPDFETKSIQELELSTFLKYFQDSMETQSLKLFLDSPAVIILQQRLIVISRLNSAIVNSQNIYVLREQQHKGVTQSGTCVDLARNIDIEKRSHSTTDILIETGVRTGLQMFFSLLRQQLHHQQQDPQLDPSLCIEVLMCLRDTLKQFPSSFLAPHHQLPPLGYKCLHDLETFLRQIVFHSSVIDNYCRSLAAETYLTLIIEKSSLPQLLEYFSHVLEMKCGVLLTETKPYVSREHLQHLINEMYESKVVSVDCSIVGPVIVEEEKVTLYRATFLLFKQLLFLANSRCNVLTMRPSIDDDVTGSCEVFAFGSNSSGQFGLGEGAIDKSPTAILMPKMSDCLFVCAGQYCTLVVYPDGYYEACGKGLYGRLGTGNSHNSASMVKVEIKGVKFTRISSSRGSDGHSLALTTEGQVYSWGEGDSGRLGHGYSTTQKSPKLIEGPFIGKIIKSVSVGWKHSAAITIKGELFTWGDGESGKLGHNDTLAYTRPKLVTTLSGVSQVSCGNTHTLALCQDRTVWSWGNGEGGKLGHGNTNRQLTPREIPSLRLHITKIQAGNHVSLALSTTGQMYSWGSGPALGRGSEPEGPCLEPWEMNTLSYEFIVDISVGEAHCLALTKEHAVYAWGNNNIGQCGLGHVNTPVYSPTKVIIVPDTSNIHQISAGTSHSIIWTALPTDLNDTQMNWPFCLDMNENTFKMLREFLEKYCTNFDTETYQPFDSLEDNIEFVVDCLNLLKLHLKCAVFLSNSQDSIGQEIIPLGQLLFKLMDSSTPQPIQNAVNETLELGATLLIPPLSERLHFLWSLIPKDNSQWTQLTKGQLIQLQVMLDSLGNEQTVIGLLVPLMPDITPPSDTIACVEQRNSILIQLVDVMAKYILAYMDKKIDESKNQSAESGTSGSNTFSNQGMSPEIISLFRDFLILLYKHIFANFAMKTKLTNNQQIFLREHLETILPACLECLEKIKLLALTNPKKLHLINDLNFPNAIIPLVTHGLLLFPLHQLNYLIDPITELCLQLSRTVEAIPDVCMLCESQEAQWSIGEISDPLLVSPLTIPLMTEFPTEWCWLVDTHRASGCLLGMLLNLQMASIPVDPVEADVKDWTDSVLFANGLQDSYREGLIQWKESTNEILPSLSLTTDRIVECVMSYETAVNTYDIPEPDSVAKLIIDLAHARTEENHICYEAYNQMIQFATLGEWDTYTDDDVIGLREVSCGMLAVTAKHCRIQVITDKHGVKTSGALSEAYESIFRVRKELFSLRPLDTSVEDTISSENSYTQLCATLRSMCLFLLFVVTPAIYKDLIDDGSTNVKDQSKKQAKSSQKTIATLETAKQQIDTSNIQADKDSPLDSIAVYFQPKDTIKHFETQIKTPSQSSKIITTITEFLLEPIRAYKAKHDTEVQKSSVLSEPIELQSKWNENLLENIAKAMAVQKKRAELRYEAIKLIQSVLLSRGNRTLGQISSILPTAYRLLQTSLLGNTGLHKFNKKHFVIMGNISSAPRDLQLKIKSAFNKILTYVFKKIAQAAKACTKAVEKEKVPLYLDLVINMSWLQGKVNCFDVNEVCSPHILSVLAELSGIISTKLPLPFPEDNKLERCIRNIAAMLFYYIAAIIGYNSSELNHTVLESVVGLLYGELEGQFIPYKPKIPVKPITDEYAKQRQKDVEYDTKNDLQIQSPINFLELSLPFEFNHPVHPETLKQLEKLWCTISNEDREHSMGSYINYLSRVVSTDKMKSHFANTAWVGLLLRISGVDPENCLPRCISIRTRISALNLLSNILTEHPKEKMTEKRKIIDVIFNQMSLCQFAQPVFHITKGDTPTQSSDTNKHVFENIYINNSCKIEGDSINKCTIGNAYLFMNYKLDTQISSWKIKLTNSDSANNSVIIGVACMPLQNTDIKSTHSCWTVDTFSGNLFHDGQLPELFSPCVTGDTIRCHFDGTTRKIYFAKNSEPLEEVFDQIPLTDVYPFISFNNKSVTASVEFLGFEASSGMTVPHRDTLELIRSELSHSNTPTPLLQERLSIGEGFTRLVRRLMQVECWRFPIQTCCNERLKLMDNVVQSLVHRKLTGLIEVHRLCFQMWPVLSLLANRAPVLSVGGTVYHTEDDMFGAISLTEYKQPLVYFHTPDRSQIPILLPTDKVKAVPLPRLVGFDWEQIGPTTLLNLAHLSGLWDDEEMNVLTAGAPFLSRGYAKHLLDGKDFKEDDSTIPISVTASLEWRQFLMWQIQTMALRTLQTVLIQYRFLHLLTYHPISINQDTIVEDQGDLAHAVQQIMRHLVSRSTSPSPLSPAVSIGCLESVQNSFTSNGMLKLYLDCADAIIGSDKANEAELAFAAIPNPPPDIPLLYHLSNVAPPLPPKTRHLSPRPAPPVQSRPISPSPVYVESLLEMGFTNEQVNRARRKLKLNSNESIANQTSSMVMWLLEHANEDESGGETETPPPLPPREEPLLYPLTLEQTLAQEGGTYPTQVPYAPVTTPVVLSADKLPKSESDKLLEGLFPDFSRTDFSSPKMDLLNGPDPTAFVRDIYRNIPDITGELRESCKRLLLHNNQGILSSQSELKQVHFSYEDCLGANAIKSTHITQAKETVFSQTDTKLQGQCSQAYTLDEYINAVERITNSIKTQIARQLILQAFSSLSLKPDDFMFGLVNIGAQDLNVLLRLLRLSYTNRFGCHNPELDNCVCISSAIKQVLSKDPESLARTLQICTRDVMASAVKTTYTPVSYFLDSHTNISDSTVFATTNFPVTKMLVEIVIDVYNSTDNRFHGTDKTEATVYSMVNLVDALSACEFSKKLSSEDKQWSTEQLVKLLVTPKQRTLDSALEPEVIIVDVMVETKGHAKQVMNSIWSEKTAQLLSISKDNTIKIWKNTSGTEELTVSSTLEFSSHELEEIPLQTSDKQEAPTPIPSTVLPYIACDQTGEYIAASRDYTLNVWYTGYVNNNNNNNNKITSIKELGKLITYTCFRPADSSTPTNTQPTEYIPCVLIGCIDGSILSTDIQLDRDGDGKLSLQVKGLDNMKLCDNGAVVKMIFDESGHTLAVGSSKGSVSLFTRINANDNYDPIKTLVLHENVIQNLQFNPSGTLLATLADGEAIKISGRLNGEWDNIGCIALPNQSCFSWFDSQTPQGNHLLACGGDRGIVYIWSIPHWPFDIQIASQSDATGLLDKQLELSVTCQSITDHITCISFSLDGVFIVAGHKDGTLSMWRTSSGAELLHTQTNKQVVSITPASNRIITCHLNSSSFYTLPLIPALIQTTSTIFYCNAKLRERGIELDKVPFLLQLISQLAAKLYRQHVYEQQEIASQKQLTHSRIHQSLTTLVLGLELDSLWSKEYIPELFPSNQLSGEVDPNNWQWITDFKQALIAVETMSKRTKLPDGFPMQLPDNKWELERESQLEDDWSLDTDTQLMQWYNQHPEDWILGGRSKVYFWGAGGSGQLSNDSKSTTQPQLCESLESAHTVIASVNCTYAIDHHGSVHSFGDGGHGKLGHNSTEAFTLPQCIETLQGQIIVDLAASKTGDGHCLALSNNGDVFSWGDGEFGRLGHGDTTKQRRPKRIEALKGKSVSMICAGDKYSAIITTDGHLYTFGSGSEGKTGLGNTDSKRIPKQVTKFLKNGEEVNVKIGQVSCSSNHTLAVSADGMEVFSFGEGQHYKLGNAATANVFSPQAIPELSGVGVKKVACGKEFSLALTNHGKIYAWGQHTECCTAVDVQRPQLLGGTHGLNTQHVVDIQAGPDYVLALTKGGEVWSWGSNKDGQLGVGDKDPRIQPSLVRELVGKNIKQISAGKNHCSASTAPPKSFLNPTAEIGQPTSIPIKYTALTNICIDSLQARLKILSQFSALVFSNWTLFSCNPFQYNSLDVLQTCHLNNSNIRPILSQIMFRSKMLQTITHTMIASKSYGPIITVRRIPTEGHKLKPLFYQISPQILIKPKELLLPQRAWKVTLIGEGADDAGGVFDETIALMCIELEDGTLPFLIPTPNARNKFGYNTDMFVLNPGCSSKTDMNYYRFIGVMFGVAIRTKKPLSLHISPLVWKLIAGIEITMDDLEEVDLAFMQAMRGIWKLSEDITPGTFSEMIPIYSYEAYNMSGQLAPVLTGGSNIPLTYSNRKEYVEKAIQFRLHELDRQALAVREGMGLVIPVPLLSLTTGASLETAVCGERELDIQILKRVAKYRDCTANDMLVKWLWDSLENFTNEEKILFLRFTSGRSRLPSRVQDVTQRLLVIKTMKNKNALPTAQTCFFHLKLPNYSSQEILAARLRYAINNCRSIDTDTYMLPRNAEGGGSTSDDEY